LNCHQLLLARLTLTSSLALLALPLGAQSNRDYQEAPTAWPVYEPVVSGRAKLDAPSGKIAAELLRYPLSGKARSMLQKALQTSDAGDHLGAVRQLRKTLDKFPDTGAYVYSLLGVEYLKTDQIPEAIDVLKQAVDLLPHDASNHANLGLSLLVSGQYEVAKPELQRALELDPHNATASRLLNALAIDQTARK
jgi:tetratricopeptide (TPR) repeat protein